MALIRFASPSPGRWTSRVGFRTLASSATGEKLQALVDNARAMLKMQDPFDEFLWSFVDGAPIQNRWRALSDVPSTTPASRAMADALKRRGFRFVGPTVCYAFMQSAGLVNDHLVSCPAHAKCAALAR